MSNTTTKQPVVFIDPLKDVSFKILFGPDNKRNMINLLRAILDRDITDIEYIDTEKLGLTVEESKSQYDLSVLFPDGTRCVVECQKTNLKYFNYRSVYYCSHLVRRQAEIERAMQRAETENRTGKPFWNYHFPPVYIIGILENGSGEIDRSLDEVNASGYLFHYRNREINCGADMNVDVNYLFLHLGRFDKSESESVTLLDQFAHSLKNMKQQTSRPKGFTNEEIQNLYDTALLANLSPEQASEIEIQNTMTTENDWLVAIHEEAERAEKRGLAKGIEKGMVKGMEKGIAEGKAEGIALGRLEGEAVGEAKAIRQTAANFKKLGVSVSDIAKATGLSEEEVQKL